jgi:quinol-cytochrome oxidoreductase complex cytochrome b subunit
MYWLHVFVLPAVGIALMVLHMALVWIQGEAEPH